jgi:hypothetical protein
MKTDRDHPLFLDPGAGLSFLDRWPAGERRHARSVLAEMRRRCIVPLVWSGHTRGTEVRLARRVRRYRALRRELLEPLADLSGLRIATYAGVQARILAAPLTAPEREPLRLLLSDCLDLDDSDLAQVLTGPARERDRFRLETARLELAGAVLLRLIDTPSHGGGRRRRTGAARRIGGVAREAGARIFCYTPPLAADACGSAGRTGAVAAIDDPVAVR